MTRLSDMPSMIALVQTAMMVPLMVVTLPAGALADMFDRRKIAMLGLSISAVSAALLAGMGLLELLSPWLLLASCVLVGTGSAIYIPAWQSSIAEQVSRENLAAAVGLSSVSGNVARSVGPALGGAIILFAGVKAAFALTASLFIPLLLAYFLWNRRHLPSRLPPERIDRSVMSGVRYALHSPGIRTVLVRVVTFGLVVAPGPALAPLVAKQVLQGDALVLGILLGAQGVGAVVAALLVSRIRAALESEVAIRWLTLGSGLSLATIGFSQSLMVTTGAFVVFGSCYITTLATLNIDLQLSISRWVVARVLSLFSSATFIGLGAGAYIWGLIADAHSVRLAFVCAGTAAIASIGLGLILPLKKPASKDQSDAGVQSGPAVCMDLTLRSGPIVIEVAYDVDPKVAREFYNAILQLQPMRQRIGGYKWSVARNVCIAPVRAALR
jgi:MFS family permease